MRNRGTLPRGAIVLVMLAGAALVPAAALARGGFAHGGHGPMFGFHHPPVIAHRPFRPAGVRHFPGRFAGWWRLHRSARQRGNNSNGIADAGYGAGYYPGSSYGPGDYTGTVAPDTAWRLPAAPAADHVGCSARGYDVPAESGGVAKVTVTRC